MKASIKAKIAKAKKPDPLFEGEEGGSVKFNALPLRRMVDSLIKNNGFSPIDAYRFIADFCMDSVDYLVTLKQKEKK